MSEKPRYHDVGVARLDGAALDISNLISRIPPAGPRYITPDKPDPAGRDKVATLKSKRNETWCTSRCSTPHRMYDRCQATNDETEHVLGPVLGPVRGPALEPGTASCPSGRDSIVPLLAKVPARLVGPVWSARTRKAHVQALNLHHRQDGRHVCLVAVRVPVV